MNKPDKTWALVPIKEFSRAKTRLRSVLTADQCAELARCMAADVLAAVRGSGQIQGISLIGPSPVVAEFARESDCDFIEEISGAGLSANLDEAARQLTSTGVDTLLVLPGDLPMLQTADIDSLIDIHNRDRRGAARLCVCPASRDDGTNALIISPPAAIEFCFGEQSARRHLEAARHADLNAERVTCNAFARDIDHPDDLIWFCRQSAPGMTVDYLMKSGICHNLARTSRATIA